MNQIIRIPDYDGGFITKSVEGQRIVTRDANGYKIDDQPVNYIRKGINTKFGKVIDYDNEKVKLNFNGKVETADRYIFNAFLSKSHTSPRSSYKGEGEGVEVSGTLETPICNVEVTNEPNVVRGILTFPDRIITKSKNEFIFIKSYDRKLYRVEVKLPLVGKGLIKAITLKTIEEIKVIPLKKILIKGVSTGLKTVKDTTATTSPGNRWNVRGGEKPGHKYNERRPHPSGKGYIYLYELPTGKREWRDEAGTKIDMPEKQMDYAVPEFKKGDFVKQGDVIGKVEDMSDNFIAVNMQGKMKLINKKEHVEKVNEHQLYKPGMEISYEGKPAVIIQKTDNLALIKNKEDNRLTVIHLERHLEKQRKQFQDKKINKYSKVYQGYEDEDYHYSLDYDKQPEYQEFLGIADKAGLGTEDPLQKKKYIKVGNNVKTVTWKYNPENRETEFLVDGVKDHPLTFMDKKFLIRDITDKGYSLEGENGEKGLFLSHEDYERGKPEDLKEDNETVIEKTGDSVGSVIARVPKKTFHISGELSPEHEAWVEQEKARISPKKYLSRWGKGEKAREEAEAKAKVENEANQKKIKELLDSNEYKDFADEATERGYKFGANKLTANKKVTVDGRKFEINKEYRLDGNISTDITGPFKKLTMGDEHFEITDLTEDKIYYNDDGKDKEISIDDLRSINGRSLFEPTKESKGLISKNEPQKFYFGSDDSNAVSGYYEVVDAKELVASHFPGGEINKQYSIAEAQNRDRGTPQSIAQINKIAKNPNFDFLGDNRTAQDGAPIVNQDYNIISGNARGIGVQLHYENKGDKYKNDLLSNAERLGFSKDEISKMEQPVLVRRVNIDNKEAQRLGAISNTSQMLATEEREQARGKATRIDDKTFNKISEVFKKAKGEHSSIAEYLDEVGPELVKELVDKGIILDNEAHLYYNTETGKLDGSHKNKVKELLTQSILGESSKHFEKIPDAAREGITKGLGEIFALKGQSGDLVPHLQNAIKILSKYNAVKDNFKGPDEFIAQDQNDAFDPLKGSKEDLAMFELLTNSKPNEIKSKIKNYVQLMQSDMFRGGMKPDEAFDEMFKPGEVFDRIFDPKYPKGVNKGLWNTFKLFGRKLLKSTQLKKYVEKSVGANDLFKAIDRTKNILIPSKKNPFVKRWQNMTEVEEYINERSKEYGGRNKFLASDEYREVYPQIKELHGKEKKSYADKALQALKVAGQKEGDRVEYSAGDPFGSVFVYEGNVTVKDGIPYVKLDKKTDDGKTQVKWHKGFRLFKEQPKAFGKDIKKVDPMENLIKQGKVTADEFAKVAHEGQKYNGSSYYEGHLVPVKEMAESMVQDQVKDKVQVVGAVALLHDVLEDTDTDPGTLRKLFGDEVVNNVELLSRHIEATGENFDNDEYYKRINSSDIAKVVKAADRIINVGHLNDLKDGRKDVLLKEYKDEMKYYRQYNIYPEPVEEAFGESAGKEGRIVGNKIKKIYEKAGLKVDKVIRAKLDDGFYVYHDYGFESVKPTYSYETISEAENQKEVYRTKRKIKSDFVDDYEQSDSLFMNVRDAQIRAGLTPITKERFDTILKSD